MKSPTLLHLFFLLFVFACDNEAASIPTCTNLQTFEPDVLDFPAPELATLADLTDISGGFITTGMVDRERLHISEFSPDGNLRWTKTLDIDSGEPIKILPVSSGGYLIGGRTKSFGSTTQFLAIRTDEQGEEIWTNHYGDSSIDNAAGLAETSAGKYLIYGTTAIADGGPRARFDLRLTCVNNAGAEEWTQTFNLTRNDNALSFMQPRQTEEKYWGLASILRENSIFNELVLLEFSPDGTETARRTLAITSQEVWSPNNFSPTNDGGAIISITTREDDTQGVASAGTLIKLTPAGTIEWLKRYPAITTGMRAVIENTEGGYNFLGAKSSFQQSNSIIYFVQTDPMGTIRWCREFSVPEFGSPSDFAQIDEGGFLVSGISSEEPNQFDFDLWMIQLDRDGLPVE